MKRKGSKHLKIAGLLEILLGAVSILAIWMILGSGVTVDTTGMDLEGALFGIIGLYAFNAFKVIAGLIGIALSNKKSVLTVVLGVLLFVVQLASFFQTGSGLIEIVINIILLAIPYYYLHNAVRNFKD